MSKIDKKKMPQGKALSQQKRLQIIQSSPKYKLQTMKRVRKVLGDLLDHQDFIIPKQDGEIIKCHSNSDYQIYPYKLSKKWRKVTINESIKNLKLGVRLYWFPDQPKKSNIDFQELYYSIPIYEQEYEEYNDDDDFAMEYSSTMDNILFSPKVDDPPAVIISNDFSDLDDSAFKQWLNFSLLGVLLVYFSILTLI